MFVATNPQRMQITWSSRRRLLRKNDSQLEELELESTRSAQEKTEASGSSHEAIAVYSCDQIQATMPAAEMATGKSIASEQHQPNLQETQKNCCYKCFRARSLSKRVPEFFGVENSWEPLYSWFFWSICQAASQPAADKVLLEPSTAAAAMTNLKQGAIRKSLTPLTWVA